MNLDGLSRRRGTIFGLVGAVLLLATLTSLHLYLNWRLYGDQSPYLIIWTAEAVEWTTWAVFAPVIWSGRVARHRRFAHRRSGYPPRLDLRGDRWTTGPGPDLSAGKARLRLPTEPPAESTIRSPNWKSAQGERSCA